MNILISIGKGDPANYMEAVEAAGGRPDARYLPREVGNYAGLILAGGGDMCPDLFGQENCGSRDMLRPRDETELELLDKFLGSGRPVLGICRGHQVANVWAGGDLIQDLDDPAGTHNGDRDKIHLVSAVKGSLLHRLYGARFSVNSRHHQGVGRLGEGLRITARSEDGVVEAMEHETLPLITVQFHPERMTGRHAREGLAEGSAVFRHFLNLCGS